MKDPVVLIIPAILMFFGGVFVGNYNGDQATFRECAVRGEAKMLSGGKITCEVKKENK